MMTHKSLASAARKPIVAVCIVASMAMGATVTMADGLAPRHRTSHFEVKFMTDMIDHHTMAIMMAELCKDRAIHDELLELGDQIIAAQSAEVQEMQSWLHDWYGIHYRPRTSGRMRKELRELAKLDGEEFEMEFLMMMVEHHSEASTREKNAWIELFMRTCSNCATTSSSRRPWRFI